MPTTRTQRALGHSACVALLVLTAVIAAGQNKIAVSPTSSGPRDLGTALVLGDLDSVKRLIASGADPNVQSPDIEAPIWFAALLMGQKNIFDAMASRIRIDRSPTESRVQIGPDALAVAAARGYLDVIQVLTKHGVSVNGRQSVGTTALLIAAANANPGVVRLLIDLHADPNTSDRHGDTALMAAARSGSLTSVWYLLRGGANPNAADRDGRTALWWAARAGRTDIVEAILDVGGDANARDNHGNSPISQAARFGYLEAVRALRDKGASGYAGEPQQKSIESALEISLLFIQTKAELWAQRVKCRSCHHTVTGAQAVLLAKHYGIKVDDELASQQIGRLREQVERWEKRAASAISSREASAGPSLGLVPEDRVFSIAGTLAPTPGLQIPAYRQLGNLAVALANLQFEDGHWIHGAARFPIESSDFLTTAHAVRGLQLNAPDEARDRVERQIELAKSWIKRNVPATLDDVVGKLYGLYWTKAESAELGAVAGELLSQQRSDGGWPQKPGMNSDAYATGLALVALFDTGQLDVRSAAYLGGVNFLLRTQESDGSWLVPSRAVPRNGYLESGSPHGKHQFVSFAGTCWATMGLILATEPAKHSGNDGRR